MVLYSNLAVGFHDVAEISFKVYPDSGGGAVVLAGHGGLLE